MTFFDIHVLAAIKLLSIVFFIGAVFCIKKQKPKTFLILFGFISAVSYIIFVNDRQLLFWGLQGDELTIAAMFNTFAHVGWWSDFAFHSFPPFYPPGFFWLFSIPGSLFNWNGIQMAKVATATTFFLFPIGAYALQRVLLREHVSEKQLHVFSFITPLLLMSLLGIDVWIGKPYEIVAAYVTVLWTISLFAKASQRKLMPKEVLVFGVLAGLICLTYYLWLVFAGMAYIFLLVVVQKNHILAYLKNLTYVAVVGILIAIPFWLPLVHIYFTTGMESWQTSFYVPENSAVWLPITQFGTLSHIFLLGGIISLLWFVKRHVLFKVLLSFLGAAFVWWGYGLTSLLLFSIPFQEFRGFYVLSPVVLYLGLSYGISYIWNMSSTHGQRDWQRVAVYVGMLFLIATALFGTFIDDPKVQTQMSLSKALPVEVEHLRKTMQDMPHVSTLTTLSTIPQLSAFIPLNQYIYFNQHNSHPASIFSVRYETVTALAHATSPEEAYDIVTNAPYGPIDQFIFSVENGGYVLYFHLDKPIEGIEERRLVFSKDVFSEEYFEPLYETNFNVILRRRSL